MHKKFNHVLILGILILFWVSSCNNPDNPKPSNEYLVSSELIGTETVEEFKLNLESNIGSGLGLFVQSGFEKYKITYNTTNTDGTAILASGALFVPTDIDQEMLLGSYQHGTLFNEADAPSYFNNESEATIASFFASTGMIIAMPDYIGYGVSKNLPHPYEHNKGLAQANVDYLFAVQEFIENQAIKWSGKTVLAGYSLGGYATMATLKLIEEEYSNQFDIAGASCGGGAYDKTGTFMQFLTEGTSGESANNRSYIWVLLTYDRIYNINAPLSDYFIEPYRTQIEQDGYLARIDKSINEIINPELIASYTSGTNQKLIDAVADNDIYDWKPQAELKLYHGDADTYVPIINSLEAFDAMKARGANSVTLDIIEGGTHGSSIGDFFIGTFAFFNEKKSQ